MNNNLKQWIENINKTDLCKYRKKKAIDGLKREFENPQKNETININIESTEFSSLFLWSKTPEPRSFWILINETLRKTGGNKILPF